MIKLKKSLTTWGTLVTVSVLALLLYVASKAFSNGKQSPQASLHPDQIQQIILDTVQAGGYGHSVAQYLTYVSKMETAKWSSNVFRTRVNLWGMKTPQQRETTAINKGTSDTWAKYDTVRDSAKDIVLYMNEFNYPKSVGSLEDLIMVMKSKDYFAGESFESYFDKVVNWIER
jgi:hypothetical protein